MTNRLLKLLGAAPLTGLGLLLACGTAATAIPTDSPPSPNVTTIPPAATAAEPDAPSRLTLEATDTPTPTASAGSASAGSISSDGSSAPEISDQTKQELREAGIAISTWKTDFNQHSVPFTDILSGGPPRDGIPPLDNPVFTTIEDANEWLDEKEPIVFFEYDGDARAYPLQILTWHEIVNDVVGGIPVAVTFCPLCNSAITFDRRLDGVTYDFGTSGKLRNSDLIMWDRQTESWWQQLTGEAIVGTLNGKKLTFLPSSIISWSDFKAAHPDGQVLSQDTGFNRRYGQNPYVGYDEADNPPFLFRGDLDGRLLPKERIVAVNIGDVSAAFSFTILDAERVINYTVGEQDLVVFFKPGTRSALDGLLIGSSEEIGATGVFDPNLDGQKLTFRQDGDNFVDNETNTVWSLLGTGIEGPQAGKQLTPVVHANHFWFAWAAFRPDTLIYQAGSGSTVSDSAVSSSASDGY